MSSKQDDLLLLSQAAREAGKIALKYFGKDPQVWMKEGLSPVSEADLAIDAFLKKTLLDARPDYGWISEETADERIARSYQRYFVVDPIDGTRGFLDKSSLWCVSIAIIENGRPIAGVLECPIEEEHFSACLGESACLNGNILPITSLPKREKLLISCPSSVKSRLPSYFVEKTEFYRYVPSLAYRIALLTVGKVDMVFVRPNCHDWDIAAADIILEQSGQTLIDINGQKIHYGIAPFQNGFLLAGAASSLEMMSKMVRDLGFS